MSAVRETVTRLAAAVVALFNEPCTPLASEARLNGAVHARVYVCARVYIEIYVYIYERVSC